MTDDILEACEERRRALVRQGKIVRILLANLDSDTAKVFNRACSNTSTAEIADVLEWNLEEVKARIEMVWEDLEEMSLVPEMRLEALAVLQSCARLEAFRDVVLEERRMRTSSEAWLEQLMSRMDEA